MKKRPLTAKPAPRMGTPSYPSRAELGAAVGGAGLLALGAATLPGCDLGLRPIVAPLFEHGSGEVGFGCKAVTPPAYLSEEMALEILREEMATVGVELKGPEHCSSYSAAIVSYGLCLGAYEVTTAARVDRLDACTDRLGIGVEVVTKADHDDQSILRLDCPVSGGSRSIKAVARHVAQSIEATGRGTHVGVLYEPADTGGIDYDYENDELLDSRKLRLQAQDLAAWLEEQGALLEHR